MNFIVTKHAKERLAERKIRKPNAKTMRLKHASKSVRRLLASKYGWKGELNGVTFFMHEKEEVVYLCRELRADYFLLITAFKYNWNN